MTFSNPTHLYYPDPTTIPTFSPFYSSTIPPTYPTTIPNLTPTPTPNPSFPSYPHHLHDPSYHPPPSFTYPPYSSYPNSTASPSPNHYTSYTTFSPSDYAYSNHYNYTQHPSYHTPFLPQQPNQTPNSNYLQHITTLHDQQISSKPAEISGKYKKEWEEYQRVFAEKLQAIRLAHKENLQKVSDKYTALKQSKQERLVTTNSEKVAKEKPQTEETEFTISVEEKESTEEDNEEKKQEFKTHRDSLSQLPPPCPKLPPTQFLSTLSSPALLPQPQVFVPLLEPPSKLHLKLPEINISPAPRPPSKPPDLQPPPSSSRSLLGSSLPRPQKKVSHLLPASPPSSKLPSSPPPMSAFTSSPWKPPDPSPNLLITQYLPLVTPITLPPSPLNPSSSPKLQPPPKPPEKVFFPFSPFPALSRPQPEPPDLQSTSESILPLPPTSRPPRKPPDHGVPTTLPSQFHSIHLRKHHSPIFQSPSDTILWKVKTNHGHSKKKNCHVSNCLDPST
ncbi:unnamed protein product [Trifolium pratense]|uniref:Uncharacterized protein n=1 Tax=Trifolium pratense TaxID=57577 RepID=A0ACB0KBG2_TRIPR|nr:unnamed protein product [Trifolium pratense]